MDQPAAATRPWYRLHLATIVLLIIVGVAVAYCQFAPYDNRSAGGLTNQLQLYSYGWPWLAVNRTDQERLSEKWLPGNGLPAYEIIRREFTIEKFALGFDVAVSMLLLASAAIACEQWQRRPTKLLQWSLRDLLMLTTVTGALVALYHTQPVVIMFGGSSWAPFILIPVWPDDLRVIPWYIAGPLFIGIACTIYAAALFIIGAIGLIKKMVLR